MAKAGKEFTAPAAAATGRPELPLNDDVRWRPIEAAHERRFERTGDNGLAVLDLMEALKQDRLPCMARSRRGGERRLVAGVEWADKIELRFWKGRVRVFSRQPTVRMRVVRVQSRYIRGDEAGVTRTPIRVLEQVRDWVFYVWQPNFEAIWPTSETTETRIDTKTWVTRAAKEMKVSGDIPEGITGFARELERRMLEAANSSPAVRPVGWQYIKNQLGSWGLWPAESIEVDPS